MLILIAIILFLGALLDADASLSMFVPQRGAAILESGNAKNGILGEEKCEKLVIPTVMIQVQT